MRPKVYVAGPLTKGDQFANVAAAIKAGNELILAGFAPMIPHLYVFLQMSEVHDYETWLEVDFEWLACADAVLRLPGESAGADRETALAVEHGIPVFEDMINMTLYLRKALGVAS